MQRLATRNVLDKKGFPGWNVHIRDASNSIYIHAHKGSGSRSGVVSRMISGTDIFDVKVSRDGRDG